MKKLITALFVGLLLAGPASAFFSFLEQKRDVGEPDNMVFYSDGMGGVLNAKTHIPEYPASTKVGVVFFHGDNPQGKPNKNVTASLGAGAADTDNSSALTLHRYHAVSFTRPDFCSESGCSSYINGFTDWRSHKQPQIDSMCGAIRSYIESKGLLEVVVVGASGGAWSAFSAAVFCPDLVRGAVLFALPCNHTKLASYHGHIAPPEGTISPYQVVDRLKSPTALIMGKNDGVTPHTHCDELINNSFIRYDLMEETRHRVSGRVWRKISRRILKIIREGRL